MSIHENSKLAHKQERTQLSLRAANILAHLKDGRPRTDRMIKVEMNFPDMNNVRPRITELISGGFINEVGSHKCNITGKRVRLVQFLPMDIQQKLPL